MNRRALQVCFALCFALAVEACGGADPLEFSTSGGNTGGAGGGATGTGGDGGAPEGCIDIFVEGTILPGPRPWYRDPVTMSRHPFWRDDRGIHAAWLATDLNKVPALVVSSFDAATGAVTQNRFYDVFPPGLGLIDVNIEDAAGAPDGRFAVIFYHGDGSIPASLISEKIVFSHLDTPDVWNVWPSPWQASYATMTDVGWDGEAFAVHARVQANPSFLLTRVLWDGSAVVTLLGETYIGNVNSVWEELFDIATDSVTGITRVVSPGPSDTLWLAGHLPDGTMLQGTEATGGIAIGSSVGYWFAVAPAGEQAMLAWTVPADGARLQRTQGTTPAGNTVTVPLPGPGFGIGCKAVVRWQHQWWMGADIASRINAYTLSDTEVLDERILVTDSRCPDTCPLGERFDVRELSAVAWGDELWFGFWDLTNSFNTSVEHPIRSQPYRIVRIKDGCTYRSAYDLQGKP